MTTQKQYEVSGTAALKPRYKNINQTTPIVQFEDYRAKYSSNLDDTYVKANACKNLKERVFSSEMYTDLINSTQSSTQSKKEGTVIIASVLIVFIPLMLSCILF